MDSSIVTLVADSDHRERRFACTNLEDNYQFGVVVEYKKKVRMNLELISSGKREIGLVEVGSFIKNELSNLGGRWKEHGIGELETWFSLDGVDYNYRHVLVAQYSGDIAHLTIRDVCLARDYEIIKKWFFGLSIFGLTHSSTGAGDLVKLIH